jgi:hypothetical protein
VSIRIGRENRDGYAPFYAHGQRLGEHEWRGWWKVWTRLLTGHVEYHWARRLARIGFGLSYEDEDREFMVHLLLGPLSLWVSLGSKFLPRVREQRTLVKLTIEGTAVFWSFWHGWSDNKGSGMFHIEDKIFGHRRTVATEIMETYRLAIPMPEATYPGTVTVTRYTFKRARWPRATVQRSPWFEPDNAIPVPGNMESDFYDGEDGIYGIGLPDARPWKQIAHVVEAAYRDRVRHGGSADWQPPTAA